MPVNMVFNLKWVFFNNGKLIKKTKIVHDTKCPSGLVVLNVTLFVVLNRALVAWYRYLFWGMEGGIMCCVDHGSPVFKLISVSFPLTSFALVKFVRKKFLYVSSRHQYRSNLID